MTYYTYIPSTLIGHPCKKWRNFPLRSEEETGNPTWGLTLKWPLNDCTGVFHTHALTTSTMTRLMLSAVVNFQAATRNCREPKKKKCNNNKGQKQKPYSMLEHQHLEFLSCISYYNSDWSSQRSTLSRNSVRAMRWISFHLCWWGFQQHSASDKWGLYWARGLGSIPASLWKWDEPMRDWSEVSCFKKLLACLIHRGNFHSIVFRPHCKTVIMWLLWWLLFKSVYMTFSCSIPPSLCTACSEDLNS